MARRVEHAFAVWAFALDAMVALEYSVKDSHHDAFAQQLEPALGKLAADIHNAFST